MKDENSTYQGRSFPELVSLGISSLILAALICLIAYNWSTKKNQPPILTVNTEAIIQRTQEQYYVPFTVTNEGGSTAESIEVVAELTVNGEIVESGSQQIDFLSGSEVQQGAFIFTRNPQTGDLKVRVSGYKLP